MNINSEYKNKYLKYKNKYVSTKNRIIQKGGAFPFHKNVCEILYIMAKIDGDTLDRINERRNALGLQLKNDLHISFLQLYLNNDHPNYNIFLSKEFTDTIIKSWNDNIISNNVILNSTIDVYNPLTQKTEKRGQWDFFGRHPKLSWVRIYKLNPSQKQYVKNFRMDIYNFLTTKIGQLTNNKQIRGMGNDQEQFDIYSYAGQELYAINSQNYVGIDNWIPHISVLNVDEIVAPELYKLKVILDNPTIDKNKKLDLLKLNIAENAHRQGHTINPISVIKLEDNVSKIKFSIKKPISNTTIREEYLNIQKMPFQQAPQNNDMITKFFKFVWSFF